MSKKRFANVWDAIENTPAQAENMKLRSALMMALKVQISFARFLRLLLETMQHVNCIIELRHIQHSECSRGIANPNFPHPLGRRRICMKKPELLLACSVYQFPYFVCAPATDSDDASSDARTSSSRRCRRSRKRSTVKRWP